ncbi:hypothetical protein DICVIV_11147 [Dictyocaulus viviparus]|uniref:Uncharacterized protein n=1 Tax=Dictyocaulus viviparus TaxID=29172 RepID=A0A0D8XDY8_DICVI|nr:hypothetical protein DICVIV_11147 [Dictyocaulus viviparus]
MSIVSLLLFKNVSWGASRWLPENKSIIISLPSAVDDCLVIPTCIQCFVTTNPPRPILVLSNKAGTITFVDLSCRKCVAELNAPQSIHEIEIIQNSDSSNVILTSFTGAQWIIPLENGGRSITEVLSSCIPSEFKKVEPVSSHVNQSTGGITVLDSAGNFIEFHNDLSTIGAISKKRFKVTYIYQ